MTDGDFVVIGLAGLFFVVFSALVVAMLRRERARDAALAAFCAARGWSLTETRQDRRRLRTITPATGDWRLVLRGPKQSRGTSRSTASRGSSEIRFPDPVFTGGLAVLAPAPGAGMGGAAVAVLGFVDAVLPRALLHRLVGEEFADHIGDLKDYPAPGGSGMMILATTDPAFSLDLGAAAQALATATARLGDMPAPPTIMAGTSGMGLRVGVELRDTDRIAALVEIAQALRARLPRAA